MAQTVTVPIAKSLLSELPPSVEFKTWRAPIWPPPRYNEGTFLTFKKKRGDPSTALPRPGPSEFSGVGPNIEMGDIPTINELRTLLESDLDGCFPMPPSRSQPVPQAHQPDRELFEEKGWIFQKLPALFSGGESAYWAALKEYLRHGRASGEPKAVTAGMHSLVEELEQVPGNESGMPMMAPQTPNKIRLCFDVAHWSS
jgi:hypothetical protein